MKDQATLTDNLVSTNSAKELAPPLLVYGASLKLIGKTKQRLILLENLYEASGQASLAPYETISSIIIDMPPKHSGCSYVKRAAMESDDMLNYTVAAFLTLDERDASIRLSRLAYGGLTPAPIRAQASEKVLKGEKASEELFIRAGETAEKDIQSCAGFKGSDQVKKGMMTAITKKALTEAHKRASKSWSCL
jgi:carbon-monoxide dehydrogenase medium subunit